MMDYNKLQPIIELYTCIQTEGSMSGRRNILLRTTGCTHRCWFGDGGWCDSWYSSIEPEKGKFTLDQIKQFFQDNYDITNLMISGGSPTMHPELVNELVNMFHHIHSEWDDSFITLETEGSHFIKTDLPIDLISLSPKFSNSIPAIGVSTPKGKTVDQKFVDQHNKFRSNYTAMQQLITYHNNYHIKPVIDRNNDIWVEVEELIEKIGASKKKVWCMPAGDTLEKLQPNYAYVIEECIKRGYNFTGRAHIVAYGDKRGV